MANQSYLSMLHRFTHFLNKTSEALFKSEKEKSVGRCVYQQNLGITRSVPKGISNIVSDLYKFYVISLSYKNIIQYLSTNERKF